MSSTFNTCIIFSNFCCNSHITFVQKDIFSFHRLKSIKRSFNCIHALQSDDLLIAFFGRGSNSIYKMSLTPNLSTLFSVDIMIKIPSPLNLAKWLDKNEDKLKPPIGNYMLQVGNGTQVMAVGGPNARTDFHINETEVRLRRSFNFCGLSQCIFRDEVCAWILIEFFSTLQEWFFQYKGNMTLRIFVDGDFKDINIGEGEMYLLPGTCCF